MLLIKLETQSVADPHQPKEKLALADLEYRGFLLNAGPHCSQQTKFLITFLTLSEFQCGRVLSKSI